MLLTLYSFENYKQVIIIISIIAMLYYDAVSFYKRRNNAGINRVLK